MPTGSLPTGVLGEQVLGLTEPWQACMHGLIIVKGSLVPRPRPAFRCLQYGKAASDGKLGGAWVRG